MNAKTAPLSRRMDRIDTSAIRKAFDLAGNLENPINLSIGQPHYPVPEPILEEVNRAMREGKNAYTSTQGILPLRERISRKFREENGFSVEPDRILISSGVSSLLQLLFLSMIDPGDRVLIPDPAFLIYRSMLEFFDAQIVTVPEEFTQEDLERMDPEGLKMILFSSPSNPTGHIMTEEQLRLLGNLADRSGALLVSDEIYELFDYDGKFVSAAKIYPEAVTLMGFSKTYAMTGMRLAAAAGPARIIRALTTLQQYTVVCAPAPVQWGGIRALDLDMSSCIEEYKRNRDYVVREMESVTRFSHPDGAIYLFPEVPQEDTVFVERAILEKGLIVVPGNIFSDSRNHIRISFATTRENLEKGIRALKDLY